MVFRQRLRSFRKRNLIQDFSGTKNLSGDIIVYTKDQEQHNAVLYATFKRLSDKGVTLNRDKCGFNKDQLEFFGLIFSGDGVSPDPKKVETIQNASRPTSVSEIKSFWGMTNFCARFISDHATLTEPLRRLIKTDVSWIWSDEQETAFQTLKQRLTGDTVMALFNPQKDIDIIVDASPVGLGGMLVQDKRIVAFASRALTDVESRYSQSVKPLESFGLVNILTCASTALLALQ